MNGERSPLAIGVIIFLTMCIILNQMATVSNFLQYRGFLIFFILMHFCSMESLQDLVYLLHFHVYILVGMLTYLIPCVIRQRTE